MRTIIIIIIIISSKVGFAQQLPVYSQYMLNRFLLNPAVAGSVDYAPVILTARKHWANIDHAAGTQTLSGHTMLQGTSMAIGGTFFNDNFGHTGMSGAQITGTYHLTLSGKGTKLSLGMSMTALQYRLAESDFIMEGQETDPVVNYVDQAGFVPDANFGAYLYNTNWYAGLSAHQLIEADMKINSSSNENRLKRHYYLNGGYVFKLNNDFNVEPSLLLKYTFQSPVQADINIKAYYQYNYWLGFSYRSDKSLIVMIGLKVDKYHLGYAFDYTMSGLSNYTTGSHELMLGINIGENKNNGSSLL